MTRSENYYIQTEKGYKSRRGTPGNNLFPEASHDSRFQKPCPPLSARVDDVDTQRTEPTLERMYMFPTSPSDRRRLGEWKRKKKDHHCDGARGERDDGNKRAQAHSQCKTNTLRGAVLGINGSWSGSGEGLSWSPSCAGQQWGQESVWGVDTSRSHRARRTMTCLFAVQTFNDRLNWLSEEPN